MAYTFGAGTGDDISWTTFTAGGNSTVTLWMGWFYPTTLTATRGLFSNGVTCGAEIDTTTSELRLRTDNTTDGQWTTTGVALAVNKWSFIAVMLSCNNTGPAAAWRVWAGTQESAPVECTVTTAVSPVGNFTGSTAFCLGNKGSSGTLAFQGDIGPFLVYNGDTGNATTRPVPNVTAGSIPQDEADFTFYRAVLPFWSGVGFPMTFCSFGARTTSIMTSLIDTDRTLPIVLEQNSGSNAPWRVPTISGATVSSNRSPRNYEITRHPWFGKPSGLRL